VAPKSQAAIDQLSSAAVSKALSTPILRPLYRLRIYRLFGHVDRG
jgi:hypothetical protein